MASKDWVGLRDGVEASLKAQLSKVVGKQIEDLGGPIRDASNRLVVAMKRGEAGKDLVAEISDELALRMVEKKIEMANMAGSVDLLNLGMNFLFDGALAGLGAVKL